MQNATGIKEQLVESLKGGHAFMPVDELLKKISFKDIGIRPSRLPYSFYDQFYHLRFTQKDILDYCLQKDYREHSWPSDYWPSKQAPDNEQEWEQLKSDFFSEREALANLVLDPKIDLTDPVPTNDKHTIFREVLLVIEHTAYHTGQLLILLRHLGLHSS